MLKQKKLGVVIGRFSMLHNEHVRMLIQMLRENTHVIVLVGSANRRMSNKNPFSYAERYQVLDAEMRRIGAENYSILPLFDRLYTETRWEASVQQRVNEYAMSQGINTRDITLYGQNKDKTTYYLDSFKNWARRDLGIIADIDATRIREEWFAKEQVLANSPIVLEHASPEMQQFLSKRPYHQPTQMDYAYYKKEAERFKDYPFPETLSFICVDAIIECAGHILTVTRASEKDPGYGCRALVGGFKERNLSLFDSVVAEIYQETNLRIPERTLRQSLRGQRTFDHPARNNGIPRVTHGFHFKIEPREDGKFPRAKGGDDAKASWLPNNGLVWEPIGNILSAETIMYDDHMDMVDSFVQ